MGRVRGLAVVLAIAVFLCGALLLVRGGGRRDSPGPPRGTAEPPPAASTELEKPVESGDRAPPPPAPSPGSDRTPEAPARFVLRGLVVDDATDAPIDAFEVLCTPAGAERHFVDTMLGMESSTPAASLTFVGARGRFAITVLDGEPQSVCAFADGYERSEPVVGGTSEELVIRLKRGGTVRGRVVDPSTGNPVDGALVGWIDRQGKPRTGPRERFARTDALGRFELGSVPFSARSVLAGREDLGEGICEGLGLSPESPEREVVIELRRSGG